MLKSIGYQDDTHITAETTKILNPFKLFVLVLHDPTGHLSFHQKFSQLFERLDYLTGQHLLFMGIARPSLNWYKRNEDRDYFGIWEKEQLINSFHEIKSQDNSIACYSIAKALDIDYDDLPVLIVTTSLYSSSFAVLKTNENTIEKQLSELGYFASSSYEKIILTGSSEFKDLIRNTDFLNQSEFRDNKEPLASTLADSLSFTVGGNSHFSRDATNHARNVLIKQKNELRKLETPGEAEKLKLKILTNLANRENNSNNSLDKYALSSKRVNYSNNTFFPSANNDGESANDILKLLTTRYPNIENESRIILNTTSLVYKLYVEQMNEKRFDYSPLVLGLSKFFEIEINLSAVHWIRKYLNIELPAYFKKHKPSFNDAKIAPDISLVRKGDTPQSINFNLGKNNKWQAPGIGQSELIIRTLYMRKALVESFSETEETELINAWTAIRELRNAAGHTQIMSRQDFQKTAGCMGDLINTGNLNKIISLKANYRGN